MCYSEPDPIGDNFPLLDRSEDPPSSAAIPNVDPGLDTSCHWLMDQLDDLDTAVHEAVHGSWSALEQVKQLWPLVTEYLPPSLVEESREHYLEWAMCQWQVVRDHSEVYDTRASVCLAELIGEFTLVGKPESIPS